MLAGLLALSACSASDTSNTQSALVGTWTYRGNVPSFVNITLTFKGDKTFTFVEQIAPFSTPAGVMPAAGCVTTDTFSATYAEAVSGEVNTLDWAFTSGTANAVSGCTDASLDSAGTPETADDLSDRIAQGDAPPMALTYSVTSTTLLLTSPDDGSFGVGRSPGTTFTRAN